MLLLVDEDSNFRRALAVSLRLEGVSVLECPDADAARAHLSTGGATAALVDLLLPGCHDLIAVLSAAGLRVVVTSPHAESFGLIANEFVRLPKPFGAGELMEALELEPE